jgi:putative membrane protein
VIGTAGIGLAVTAGGLTGTSASAAAAPSAQDRAFLVSAHQSNLTEIAAGQAAQRKATTEVVRHHGAIFTRDHTRLDASLRQVARRLTVPLPDSPSAEQQAILDSVSANADPAFDRAWLASQLAGHREAKANGQKELAQGSDATVKQLARAAAPVVQMHLSMLEQVAGTVPSGVDAGDGGQAAVPPGGMRLGRVLVGLALVAMAGMFAALRPRRRRPGTGREVGRARRRPIAGAAEGYDKGRGAAPEGTGPGEARHRGHARHAGGRQPRGGRPAAPAGAGGAGPRHRRPAHRVRVGPGVDGSTAYPARVRAGAAPPPARAQPGPHPTAAGATAGPRHSGGRRHRAGRGHGRPPGRRAAGAGVTTSGGLVDR